MDEMTFHLRRRSGTCQSGSEDFKENVKRDGNVEEADEQNVKGKERRREHTAWSRGDV
jgi:hypothetical protein